MSFRAYCLPLESLKILYWHCQSCLVEKIKGKLLWLWVAPNLAEVTVYSNQTMDQMNCGQLIWDQFLFVSPYPKLYPHHLPLCISHLPHPDSHSNFCMIIFCGCFKVFSVNIESSTNISFVFLQNKTIYNVLAIHNIFGGALSLDFIAQFKIYQVHMGKQR